MRNKSDEGRTRNQGFIGHQEQEKDAGLDPQSNLQKQAQEEEKEDKPANTKLRRSLFNRALGRSETRRSPERAPTARTTMTELEEASKSSSCSQNLPLRTKIGNPTLLNYARGGSLALLAAGRGRGGEGRGR